MQLLVFCVLNLFKAAMMRENCWLTLKIANAILMLVLMKHVFIQCLLIRFRCCAWDCSFTTSSVLNSLYVFNRHLEMI